MKKSSNPKADKKPGIWANILLALGSLLIFLLLLEGVFALAGVRPLSLTEDPYMGFASEQPLFIKKMGPDGVERYETNPVKLSHFNPQSFPVKKAPGTYRIFCLGGSTTYGHPYRDTTSYSGWLREMLAEADSSRHFEVINCGGISYASYREAQLVEELIQYQPDLFVIYAGHNEFLEERTYRGARNLPRWMRETSSLLDRTRTYSVIRRVLRTISGKTDASSGKTQMAAEEDNVLGRSIGPTSYTRNDTLKQEVLEHFALSLRRIAGLSQSVGARTLFFSTPSNEKDCSPFKSEPTPDISPEQRDSAAALLVRGRQLLEDSGESGHAWTDLSAAVQLDPRNAEILYQAGKAAFALKRYPEAKVLFDSALDEDICPLRALIPMRDIVRKAAEETHSGYVDFVDTLEQKTLRDQGHNILGEPDFLDHVHLCVPDYGILAHAIFEDLIRRGEVHPAPDFETAGMERVRANVMARLTPSEEGLGLHNIAKVLNWAGKQEDAARIAARGLALDSTSLESIWSSLYVGASLERHGKPLEALPHYERALRLDSNNSETRRILGEALLRLGNLGEAEQNLNAAAELDPQNIEIQTQLGYLDFSQQRYLQASAHLRIVAGMSPDNMRVAGMLAASLLESGQLAEAETDFKNVLQNNPNDANAWYGLGLIAEHGGRTSEAIQDYARSSQLDPNFAGPREALNRLLKGTQPQ